jgi:hypothetical protein
VAAVVSVLLALTAGVGVFLAPTAATASSGAGTAGSSDVSLASARSHLAPSVLRSAHRAPSRTVGVDRFSAGHGYGAVPVALLVLSLLAVLAAATTSWRRPSSVTPGASGPRAPPALAAC